MTPQTPWEQSPDNIGTALTICVPSAYPPYFVLPSAILRSQFGSPTRRRYAGLPRLSTASIHGEPVRAVTAHRKLLSTASATAFPPPRQSAAIPRFKLRR